MELVDCKSWVAVPENVVELRILVAFKQMIDELKSSTKKADKEAVIAKYAEKYELIQKILAAYSYDSPEIKTQISGGDHKNVIKYKLIKFNPGTQRIEIPVGGILSLLEILTTRKHTGDAAMHLAVCYLYSYAVISGSDSAKAKKLLSDMEPIIFGILSLDFKFGLKKSTYFDKYQIKHADFISKLQGGADSGIKIYPELSHPYKKGNGIEYSWISRKLDGERCFADIDFTTGTIVCKSRNNVVIPQSQFIIDDIKSAIGNSLKPGFLGYKNGMILDGEIVSLETGDIKTSKEKFKDIGELRAKNPDQKKLDQMYYYVFNIIDRDEMKANNYTIKYSETLKRMEQLFGQESKDSFRFKRIRMLEQIPFSDAALMSEFKNVEEKGLEGLMLRADMPYQGGKRSHYLTKYKTMQDAEFLCVAVNIGDFNTKQDGKEITLKNVMCSVTIIHPKGAQVNVGTGFTMEERKSFAQNPSLIKGKLLKIRYMEETSNQKNKEISLRFPVFLGIKTD
jgi:hypothetical protein